jgi:hypothetical protein
MHTIRTLLHNEGAILVGGYSDIQNVVVQTNYRRPGEYPLEPRGSSAGIGGRYHLGLLTDTARFPFRVNLRLYTRPVHLLL